MGVKETVFEIEFAEAANPVFMAGKNFGVKLSPNKHSGLKLSFDDVQKRLIIEWNGRVGYVPESALSFYMPMTEASKVKVETHKNHPIKANISAQVSTPMGHVFEGEGAGKTRN